MSKKSKKPACRRGRVVCAMSGGVDSSIAAAILKKKGYEVIGLFLNMHQNFNPKDAQKVAKKLNIPLKILNVRKEFKKRVVNYFIKEYRAGRTPNPCVECNKWIKFKFLMEKALKLKADFIATGHYAKIKFARPPRMRSHDGQVNSKQIRYLLITAKDKQKDQSYFLWTLTQKQLKKTLFPIGDYTKKEVRAMAKKWNLPVYEKKESQEICFVDTNLCEFLRKRISLNNGPIITTKGEKMGEHEGLAYYTIGQRKRIKIGSIGPFYVIDKDFKNNALIVVKSEHAPELYKKEMIVEKVNWISGEEPKLPLQCKVKIRYLHPSVPAKVMKHETYNMKQRRYKVVFDKSQRAITPGQSAVFYLPPAALAKGGKGSEVLGGGIIT